MPVPRILIIDDDKLSRWSMATVLGRAGYRVQEAASGKEGLAVVKRSTPDLVLLDVMLPDVDGFTVLRELREIHPALPVLMVTSAGTAETVHLAFRLGARASLDKPCDPAFLRAVVSDILESFPHSSRKSG